MTRPAQVAATVTGWDELASEARSCIACPELAEARRSVVVGTRPPEPPAPAHPEARQVLLVGEAPGRQEDEAGVPFVGAAGRLLDEILADVGLPRSDVAVTNVVKCRPPGNRKPARREMANCSPWLERQIALLDPAIVCALGGSAAEWALGRASVRIGQLRGHVLDRAGRALVVTYHPSAAIRFGPRGQPRANLREDLALVAEFAGRTHL